MASSDWSDLTLDLTHDFSFTTNTFDKPNTLLTDQ